MLLFDTHCHLAFRAYDSDREEVIRRARDAGVGQFLLIGAGEGIAGAEAAIALAEKRDDMLATVGVHPHDASQGTDDVLAELRELAKHPKVVAFGETGLDYHYDNSPREDRKSVG